MKITRSIVTAAALLLASNTALAATEELRSFTSRVEVVNSPSLDSRTTTYKITGPSGEAYVLDAPKTEVERLVKVLETDPNATLNFQGQVIEGPTKTLRVSRWERSTSSSTTTSSGIDGTTTTHKSQESTTVR